MKIIDRKTGKEISVKQLALKMYQQGANITWTDIECVLVDEKNNNIAYILDECGNWEYIDEKKYKVIKEEG